MSRRKVHAAQLEFPVPNEIGRVHDPDRAFADAFGEARLAEEQRRYIEERACNCNAPFPKLWGRRGGHKAGCPRVGRKF